MFAPNVDMDPVRVHQRKERALFITGTPFKKITYEGSNK